MLIKNIISKIWFDIHDKGWKYTIKFYSFIIFTLFKYPYYSVLNNVFSLNTATLTYFYHWYNITYANERSIEIPIIMHYIEKYQPKSVLEVGDVLGHYKKISSDVVDKYEIGKGVITMDIMDYNPGKTYDMIICISTIEHIGFEEEERNPEKIKHAITKMKSLLSPGGRLVITVPIGWNRYMDQMIFNNEMFHDFECFYFLRETKRGWRQAFSRDEIENARYWHPFPYANAVIIATFGQT